MILMRFVLVGNGLCSFHCSIIILFLQSSLNEVTGALVDRTVMGAPPLTKYQFERVGYFCVDLDTQGDKVSYVCVRWGRGGGGFNLILYTIQKLNLRYQEMKPWLHFMWPH